MPDTASAAATAVGPGIVTTATSRARAAATSSAPGSLTTGVPASVTRATSLPVPSRWRMRRNAASVEWAWKLMRSASEPTCASRILVWRVSSAATAATRFSVSAARSERSARLPSGVATTYSVPAISPRHLPRQAPVEAGRLEHVAVLLGRFLDDLRGRPGHQHFHALEQLQRPVGERVGELIGLHHGVGRVGAARHREQPERLVRADDAGAHLLGPPLGLARELLLHLVHDAPVELAVGVDERVGRLRRQVGRGGEQRRRERGGRAVRPGLEQRLDVLRERYALRLVAEVAAREPPRLEAQVRHAPGGDELEDARHLLLLQQ